MIYAFFAVLAFVFFVLSDWLGYKTKSFKYMFLFNLGCGLLILITATAIACGSFTVSVKNIFFAFLALLSLILLVYSLFFALKKENYTGATHGFLPLNDKGVYSLCRHPGVIFLLLFYAFTYIIFSVRQLLVCAVFINLSNLIYVCWQDSFLFEKTIENYNEYKKNTPFLIPNIKSIKACVGHFIK